MKKRIRSLLSLIMVVLLTAGVSGAPVFAADDPAPIQNTYELDGVTYFNVGSSNFAVDRIKFFKDMLSGRSDVISQRGEWDETRYEYKYYDQSEADLWLQTGVMLLSDLTPLEISNDYRCIQGMFHAAVRGSHFYDQQNGMTYTSTRFDVEGKNSPKEAEEWVFQKTFGGNKNFGYFKNNSTEQMTLASAVNVREQFKGTTTNIYTVAAYFTNFRIFPLIPSDEGTNYVTELITDSVNSRFTTASTVKNLTGSTVTGSQSVSNSITIGVSNSVNGSETYSRSTSKKIGASYKFTEAFQVSGEASWTEGEAFSTGWGSSDSISTSKSASYTVSVPMAPYTQAMITQSDTTSVYVTRYNCPIAILYDVTIVGYQTGQLGDGILHTKNTEIYVDGSYIPINRDQVYSFSDPFNGARGDLEARIKSCESWNSMDAQGLRWNVILNNSPEQYDLSQARDSIEAAQKHVPMSSTGAAYTQTLNVVASEVSGLMPTHPLYRVKIAEPGVNIHTDEVSYQLFDYFTANMEVGDYSYANYMSLVGLNRNDVPFYGFSKDNGYWIITDKEGNELDPEDSPVKLEKDPVSTNWRYTAVKPGTCYMVYRIDDDTYYIAERPNDPIKNEDLVKTAALEIIVTEKDPTDTIVITGSYQGHPDVAPESLEGDNTLTVAVYDETGKEIEKSYTWEAKELKGITVTGDGQVSFTKEGTYHVRAVNGKLRSDWYEITAGHKPADAVRENEIPAKCEEGGSCDLVTYCSVCGEELSRENVEEPMLLHSFDDGVITKEPTKEEPGLITYTCTRCGETKTEKYSYALNPPPDTPSIVNPPDTPTVSVNRFKDVTEDKYFFDPVCWALIQDPQIASGTSEDTFSPDAVCTRAQAVTFLWRAKGCPEPNTTDNPFSDVSADKYYYKAVLWAAENEIVKGTGATTFSPNQGCTRGQAVTFLWRTEGKPSQTDAENVFSDVRTGQYYYDAVLWAVKNEITNGMSATAFNPGGTCTRGQIVTFLYRALK